MVRTGGHLSYVPSLDGLRALAVLAVLISHFKLGPYLTPLIVDIFPWGQAGVRLFFVLSGFLITSILLNCRELIDHEGCKATSILHQFYIRRALRIFPLFYAVLAGAYFLDVGNIRDVAIYHFFYLSNISSALTGTLEGFAPLIDPASAHFWSLAVEEQFYVIWPAVVLFCSRKNILNILLFSIILSPILRLVWFAAGYDQLFSYLPMCLDSLGFGALLALHRNGALQGLYFFQKYKRLIIYLMLGLLVSMLILYGFSIGYKMVMILSPFAEGAVYACFLWLLINNKMPMVERLLSTTLLVEIGKVSYGIYILHPFVFNLVNHLFEIDEARSPVMFAIYTLLTVAVAFASWKFFEHPINGLKKYFPYDYRRRLDLKRIPNEK